jgi:hypothetical protein
MREAAGDLQPGLGCAPGVVEITALPIRVGLDGRDLSGLGADLVGGGARTDREQQSAPHSVRVPDYPFQSPCAAHRSADDGGNLIDTQCSQCGDIGLHLVAHRNQWKP